MEHPVKLFDLPAGISGTELLDRVEVRIVETGGAYRDVGEELDLLPVTHRFTPGLYVREIFMPAGAIVVSATHKFEHPFIVSKGRCSVWRDGEGWETIAAPHTGITAPGTRRLLLIHEDTIWTTFHVTEETTPAGAEAYITEPRSNPYMTQLLEGRNLISGGAPCLSQSQQA
jgi:quercetin dioxygenase-like cupin family protein